MYDFGMSNTQEGASPQGLAPTVTQATNPNEIPRAILRALSKPFGPSQVRWRLGSGAKVREGQPPPTEAKVLAYIDARDCHNRLDAVLGLDWECSYTELRQGKIVVCAITITVGGRKITRSNGADDTDVEPNMGAMSVAFRRAATMFGIGRDLYGYPSPKVKVKPYGKSFVIDDAEKPKLQKIVADKLAAWEKAEAERAAKAKVKRDGQVRPPARPTAAQPQEQPMAPPASSDAAEDQKTALFVSWKERISIAGKEKDKAALDTIGAEIAKGPFAPGSEEHATLGAEWSKAMRMIDPNHGKRQRAAA